jgi:type IV pilus assembly protein PilP
MSVKQHNTPVGTFGTLICLVAVLLAGCSGRDGELDQFISATKTEPGGRVEPLPEVKPYDSYVYTGSVRRSPFVPGGSAAAGSAGPRPVSNRSREFLEQFSLDTLRMVGTLNLGGKLYGLVQVRDGRVHRVLVGNYLGQNDGRIDTISSTRINVTEVVPDGLGGYLERPAALALNE